MFPLQKMNDFDPTTNCISRNKIDVFLTLNPHEQPNDPVGMATPGPEKPVKIKIASAAFTYRPDDVDDDGRLGLLELYQKAMKRKKQGLRLTARQQTLVGHRALFFQTVEDQKRAVAKSESKTSTEDNNGNHGARNMRSSKGNDSGKLDMELGALIKTKGKKKSEKKESETMIPDEEVTLAQNWSDRWLIPKRRGKGKKLRRT